MMEFDGILKLINELSDVAVGYLPHLKAITVADLLFALTYYRKIKWKIKKAFRCCFALITAVLLILVAAGWNG